MLILLLFFLALLHLSRQAEFDASRCAEEMVCFTPMKCISGQNANDFARNHDTAKIDKCDVVLAIRPYSPKKWIVAMRGKGVDAAGIKLSITVGSQSAQLMFECKPNGDKSEVAVGSGMTKGTAYATYFNGDDKNALCEFEVSRPTNFDQWPNLGRNDKLTLSYTSAGSLKSLRMKQGGLFDDVDHEKGCNPDDIQFEPAGSESEHRMKVDGHLFAAACPDGFTLSAKWTDGASSYSPVAALECAALPDDGSGDAKFAYHVTAADGAAPTPIGDASNLFARCSQKRCLACAAVQCGKEAGCVAAKHTPGAGDACAKLECEGNRFEIPYGQSAWKQVEGQQPACSDGQWSMGGTQFATARCFKICPALNCKGCKGNNTTDLVCENGRKMKITYPGGNSKMATRLDCDSATGKWKGAVVGTTASISCESSTDEQIGTAGMMKTPLQNSIVIAGVLSLLIIIGSVALWFWRFRTQKAKLTNHYFGRKEEKERSGEGE